MKKLFFVFVCIFLSFNVFAFEFEGSWQIEYETLDGEVEKMNVEFINSLCIFHKEKMESVYNYKRDDNFFFLAGLGYEIKVISDDEFILFPRHGSDIKYIMFVRVNDERKTKS
jgi:hypothetical protein